MGCLGSWRNNRGKALERHLGAFRPRNVCECNFWQDYQQRRQYGKRLIILRWLSSSCQYLCLLPCPVPTTKWLDLAKMQACTDCHRKWSLVRVADSQPLCAWREMHVKKSLGAVNLQQFQTPLEVELDVRRPIGEYLGDKLN